jgi:HEAT repeat protein
VKLRSLLLALSVSVAFAGCAPTMKDFPKLQQSFLSEQDAANRQKIVKKAGKIKDATPEVRQFLQEALKNDKSPSVRQESIDSLIALNATSSADTIKAVLVNDSSSEVRSSAVRALYSFEGRNSFGSLKLAVRDKDPRVRSTSINFLAKVDGAEAVNLIAECLQRDVDQSVRASAATAIVQTSYADSFSLLKNAAINDPSLMVKSSAVEAIGVVPGDKSLDFLAVCLKDESLQEAALTALARNNRGHDSPEIITLIIDMMSQESTIDDRKVSILLSSNDRRVDSTMLKVILSANDNDIVSRIAKAYKSRGNYSLVPPLVNALYGSNSRQQTNNSITALGTFGDNRGVPPLLSIARGNDGCMAMNAIWALGNMQKGDMEVWNCLCGLHKFSPDKDVSWRAGESLFNYYNSAAWRQKPQVCEKK